ncbi:MAG: drug/metabolite transporter (DMT)-like permease [Paracoccaceae bacterium]
MTDIIRRADRARMLRAIGLLFISILCFDVMSILVRLLLADYSAQELSAYRNVFGIIPSLILMIYTRELRLRGTSLYIKKWPLAIFRGFVIAFAQLFFYSSLGFLELATVSALAQTNALFVVLLSVVLLGEKVGIWRWSALGLGFVGALMILQPGSDAFSVYALLPVAAAVCYAISIVTVRLFDPGISNSLLYLYSSAASALGAFVLAGLTTTFSPVASLEQAGMIFLMSMMGGTGVLFLMLAYRMASPSILAPFGYFGLLTAFAFGWLFFGEAPIETLFPGVFVIVAAGAIIIWRENRA